MALALGEFKLYAAIEDAHVFYNGRTTRRVQVKEIAIYIMAPYGFDALKQGMPYRGHFNKKHFALVTNGDWVNAPVFVGRDMYARHAVLRPVATPQFMQWRERHGKGGDMLLFSERRPSFPNMDVEVPLLPVDPVFKIIGRIAGKYAGYVGVPFPDLHLTLLICNTEQGTIGIDGQPTGAEAGLSNMKKIRTNFYYNVEPTDVVIAFDLKPSTTMTNEEVANRFIAAAQNFASYTESYSVPEGLTGESMRQGEYNSGSYLAGLVHSVLGYVPKLDFYGKALQAPGWDMPLPDSCFKGEALK